MAATVSPSLTVVIPTAVIAQVSSAVVVLTVVYRLEGPFSRFALSTGGKRVLLRYGSWTSVSNIISPLLASFDQFLIGSIMGVASVAHYAVPMSSVVRSQIFPAALGAHLLPAHVQFVDWGGPIGRACALFARIWLRGGMCSCNYPLAGVLSLLDRRRLLPLLAAPVAQILFLGAWINGLAVPFTPIQSHCGRPDITGKLAYD